MHRVMMSDDVGLQPAAAAAGPGPGPGPEGRPQAGVHEGGEVSLHDASPPSDHQTPPLASPQAPPFSSHQAPPPSDHQTPPPYGDQALPRCGQQAPPPSDHQTPPPYGDQALPPCGQQAPPPSDHQTPPPYSDQALPPCGQQAPPPSDHQTPPPYGDQTLPPCGQQAAPPSDHQTPPPYGDQALPRCGQQAPPPFDQQTPPPYGDQALPRCGQQAPPPSDHQTPPPYGDQALSPCGQQAPPPSDHQTPLPYGDQALSPCGQQAPPPSDRQTPPPCGEQALLPCGQQAPPPSDLHAPPLADHTASPADAARLLAIGDITWPAALGSPNQGATGQYVCAAFVKVASDGTTHWTPDDLTFVVKFGVDRSLNHDVPASLQCPLILRSYRIEVAVFIAKDEVKSTPASDTVQLQEELEAILETRHYVFVERGRQTLVVAHEPQHERFLLFNPGWSDTEFPTLHELRSLQSLVQFTATLTTTVADASWRLLPVDITARVKNPDAGKPAEYDSDEEPWEIVYSRGLIAPRHVTRGDVTLATVLGDAPPGGTVTVAVARAVALAFLLGADAGQMHWRPSDVDHLVFQGIEIQKRCPEVHCDDGYLLDMRTRQMRHTVRAAKTSQVTSPISASTQAGDDLESILSDLFQGSACGVLQLGKTVAAVVRRAEIMDKTFLLFTVEWNALPELLEMHTLRGLCLHLNTLMGRYDGQVIPMTITRKLEELPDPSLPDFEELCKQGLKEYKLSGADDARLHSPKDYPQGVQTPRCPPRRMPVHWETPKDGLMDMFVDVIDFHRRRFEERKDITLSEEVAILEQETFSYRDPDTLALQDALRTLIADLCEALGAEDPLWRGATVHGMGSFFDGTRVSKRADEYDILVSVSLPGVAVRREVYEEDEEEEDEEGEEVEDEEEEDAQWLWCVWVTGEALEACKEHGQRPSILVFETQDRGEVSGEDFYDRWRDALGDKLTTITLPPGLSHDGPVSPAYCGLSNDVPAVTPNLIWQNSVRFTLDLTLGFPVSAKELPPDVVHNINLLARLADLPQIPRYPAHVVPGGAGWILSTGVLERQAVTVQGPQSPVVALIRGLKLLARRYLHWGILDAEVMRARHAVETLVAVGRGDTPPEEVVSPAPGHAVDTLVAVGSGDTPPEEVVAPAPGHEAPRGGPWEPIIEPDELVRLARSVKTALDAGRLPDRDDNEGPDKYNYVGLGAAATHRVHRGLAGWPATGDQHRPAEACHEKCVLCRHLLKLSQRMVSYPNLFHPAVAEAIGLHPKPRIEIKSVYFKCMVLDAMLKGADRERSERDVTRKPERVADPEGPPTVEANLRVALQRLAVDLQGEYSGHSFTHPLLGTIGMPRMSPRSARILNADLDEVQEASSRALVPAWYWLPQAVVDCHTELCRRLGDLSVTHDTSDVTD